MSSGSQHSSGQLLFTENNCIVLPCLAKLRQWLSVTCVLVSKACNDHTFSWQRMYSIATRQSSIVLLMFCSGSTLSSRFAKPHRVPC